MSDELLYAVEDGVALLTLHRPDRLNAMTPTMRDALASALAQAQSDASVRVAVLTGAGRGFCAGADIGRLQGVAGGGDKTQAAPTAPAADRYNFIGEFDKPLLGCINGVAAGVGMVLALQCDLRWAANEASFLTAFARRGLIAEYGCAFLLERLVGPAMAADLLFSSRKVSGSEAATIGLVNHALPVASLLPTVLEYARVLVHEVSPRSLAVMKRQLKATPGQTLAQSMALAGEEMAKSFASEDFCEGVAHFVEKRAPAFSGR